MFFLGFGFLLQNHPGPAANGGVGTKPGQHVGTGGNSSGIRPNELVLYVRRERVNVYKMHDRL